MAIARGAGTEIIRSHAFEDMSGAAATNKLIVGEAHHIYTVMSIIIRCGALDATTDKFTVNFYAFDLHAGAANQNIELFTGNPQVGETLYGMISSVLMVFPQQVFQLHMILQQNIMQ